jgi:cobalt-precorrin 5A hydrolase
VVGIGCNRGTPAQQIEWALRATLDKYRLSFLSIGLLASIDLKADEQGLLEFADHMKLPLRFYSRSELNRIPGLKRSSAVFQAIGAYGVAEPAAIQASDGGRLIVEKMKWRDVTIAIAEKKQWTKENYT